eukprot:TRINITY_DN2619_c0_g1_i2.p1 TRINITY_DN2619_c0_g1~~TRINITY_DN2619_c0_g1_i2.p1  ORF type:complete len:882 (+),score=260.26 TRINITY_DN2619_c0_g1_i2:96-2741(+)
MQPSDDAYSGIESAGLHHGHQPLITPTLLSGIPMQQGGRQQGGKPENLLQLPQQQAQVNNQLLMSNHQSLMLNPLTQSQLQQNLQVLLQPGIGDQTSLVQHALPADKQLLLQQQQQQQQHAQQQQQQQQQQQHAQLQQAQLQQAQLQQAQLQQAQLQQLQLQQLSIQQQLPVSLSPMLTLQTLPITQAAAQSQLSQSQLSQSQLSQSQLSQPQLSQPQLSQSQTLSTSQPNAGLNTSLAASLGTNVNNSLGNLANTNLSKPAATLPPSPLYQHPSPTAATAEPLSRADSSHSLNPAPKTKKKQPQRTVESFTMSMASEARQKNRKAAEAVLSDAKIARCVNADLYKPLIRLYGELDDPEAAEQVIQDMKENTVAPDASTYGTLLAAHSRKRGGRYDTPAAERVLQRAKDEKKVNVQMFSCLMSLYGEMGHPEKAEEQLEEMQKLSVKPDANTYSTLIAAYAKKKEVDKAKGVLDRAKKAKCVNADLYKPLMRLYGTTVDSNPEELIEDMENNGVHPHASTFATLLAVHARSKDRKKAEEVLHRAKKEGKVNAHIYSPLMRLYGELKDSEAAEALLQEMLDNEMKPDISIYATLLAVHAGNKNRDGATKVLERAKLSGFAGKQIYKGLMNLCSDSNDPAAAEFFLNDMLKDTKTPPTPYIFETIIASYCKQGDIKAAMRILDQAKMHNDKREAGTPPLLRAEAFKHIMDMFKEEDNKSGARQLVDILASCQINSQLADEALEIIDLHDRGETEEARRLIEEKDGETRAASAAKQMLTSLSELLEKNERLYLITNFANGDKCRKCGLSITGHPFCSTDGVRHKPPASIPDILSCLDPFQMSSDRRPQTPPADVDDVFGGDQGGRSLTCPNPKKYDFAGLDELS